MTEHVDANSTQGSLTLGELLGGLSLPLYALLDAAREPAIPGWLANSGQQFESLYSGDAAKELEDVAPYLVRLTRDSELRTTLVRRGWGQAWGVYVLCADSFDEVRRHFRRLLKVEVEDGHELFFRFYDPRVLRDFLPTCSLDQLNEFFGPVHQFLLEGEDPQEALFFSNEMKGLGRRVVRVSAAV